MSPQEPKEYFKEEDELLRVKYRRTLIHWIHFEKVIDDLGKNRFSILSKDRCQTTMHSGTRRKNEETEPVKCRTALVKC